MKHDLHQITYDRYIGTSKRSHEWRIPALRKEASLGENFRDLDRTTSTTVFKWDLLRYFYYSWFMSILSNKTSLRQQYTDLLTYVHWTGLLYKPQRCKVPCRRPHGCVSSRQAAVWDVPYKPRLVKITPPCADAVNRKPIGQSKAKLGRAH